MPGQRGCRLAFRSRVSRGLTEPGAHASRHERKRPVVVVTRDLVEEGQALAVVTARIEEHQRLVAEPAMQRIEQTVGTHHRPDATHA